MVTKFMVLIGAALGCVWTDRVAYCVTPCFQYSINLPQNNHNGGAVEPATSSASDNNSLLLLPLDLKIWPHHFVVVDVVVVASIEAAEAQNEKIHQAPKPQTIALASRLFSIITAGRLTWEQQEPCRAQATNVRLRARISTTSLLNTSPL